MGLEFIEHLYDALMGMNPSKYDKWPRYEKPRHVLIKRQYRYERPWQGFVVDMKSHSYKWSALVAWVPDDDEDDAALRIEWFPVEQLEFVRTDPNYNRDDGYRYP